MSILQDMGAWLLLVLAVITAGRIFFRQLNHAEVDPKCQDCPIPDLKQGSRDR